MGIVSIFDQGAWIVIRLVGLLQALLAEITSVFYHPNPCKRNEYKDFMDLYSMLFSGWMLFHSQSPDDLPSMIREKMLWAGRFLLGFCIIIAYASVVMKIMGK